MLIKIIKSSPAGTVWYDKFHNEVFRIDNIRSETIKKYCNKYSFNDLTKYYCIYNDNIEFKRVIHKCKDLSKKVDLLWIEKKYCELLIQEEYPEDDQLSDLI